MRIERIDKRTIVLRSAKGEELGRLHRPSIWRSRWEVIIAGEGLYTMEPRGGLNMDMVLCFDDGSSNAVELLWMRHTMKGRLHFTMPGSKTPLFVVRRPSVWRTRYVLEDADGRLLADIRVAQRLFGPREFIMEEVGDPAPDTRQMLLAVMGIGIMMDRAAAAA